MTARDAAAYLGFASVHPLHKLTSARAIPFAQDAPGSGAVCAQWRRMEFPRGEEARGAYRLSTSRKSGELQRPSKIARCTSASDGLMGMIDTGGPPTVDGEPPRMKPPSLHTYARSCITRLALGRIRARTPTGTGAGSEATLRVSTRTGTARVATSCQSASSWPKYGSLTSSSPRAASRSSRMRCSPAARSRRTRFSAPTLRSQSARPAPARRRRGAVARLGH